MGKKLTNFEESLRSSFDDFDPTFDAQSWEEIENRLDQQQEENKHSSSVLSGVLIVLASVLLLAFFYFMIRPSNGSFEQLCEGDKGVMMNRAIHGRTVADLPAATQEENFSDSPSDEGSGSGAKTTVIANAETQGNAGSTASNSVELNGSEEPTADENPVNSENEGDKNNDNSDELVKVEGSSKVAFKSSISEACAGVEVEFELLSEEIDGSYLWNFGDGNFSNQPNPKHTFSKPGVYDISLSVRSLEDGVIRSNSVSKMIVINPKPKANFEWEFINDQKEITQVHFMNRSERAGEAEWHFHNGEISTEINPENNYKSKGEHLVKLVVKNKFGCVDSTFKYVDVKRDYNLNAPKTFSLKSGEGFMPEALKDSGENFSLTIYDNKQPIFETMSTDNPWDGKDAKGEKVLPGMSYPWVVIVYDESNNEKEIYSGTVTVQP